MYVAVEVVECDMVEGEKGCAYKQQTFDALGLWRGTGFETPRSSAASPEGPSEEHLSAAAMSVWTLLDVSGVQRRSVLTLDRLHYGYLLRLDVPARIGPADAYGSTASQDPMVIIANGQVNF